ncbi:MAG: Ig-like domain-containing protein [Clostridia bacterium]|nr:Ig-like domain-containing protein [Clostridia bacterium]
MKRTIKKYSLLILSAVMVVAVMAAAAFGLNMSAKASADPTRFAMTEGANIRLVSPKGLRFIAEMGSDVYTDLTTAENGITKKMGMYIVPSSYLGDSSKYSSGVKGVVSKEYQNLITKIDLVFYSSDGSIENKIYQEGDYYRANGVIAELKLNNYDREFIGIAYISRTSGTTTTYTFADFDNESNARTPLYVAVKSYEEYKNEPYAKAALDEYILGAHLKTLGMTEIVSGEPGSRTFTYSYQSGSYDSINAAATAANCDISLSMDTSSVLFNSTEGSATFTATISDSGNAGSINMPIDWTSDNTDVATVDNNGVVNVVGSGEANITARFMGQSKSRKVMVFDGTFETMSSVPSYMTKAGNAGTPILATSDGDKCLKIPITGSTPKLNVDRDFLASYFADTNVQYIGFDAKSDIIGNGNFRRYTWNGSALNYVTYEYNNSNYGVRPNEWKSFYFSRADYNYWVNNDITAEAFIYASGCSNGDNLYVDNIRPLTQSEYLEEVFGFDTGWSRLFNSQLLYYPSYGSAANTYFIAINVDTNPSAYGMTYDTVSHGIRALTFTKSSGTYTVQLNTSAVGFTDLRSTGYYAFDLYVSAGSDAYLTGSQNDTYIVGTPKTGKWTTIYVNNASATPIKLTDTTGGTYCVDHFRSITEEEYNAALFSFETGVGGIRDNTATSDKRFYYYAGADYTANRWSMYVRSDGTTLSDPHFDSTIKHDGDVSLAFTKTTGGLSMTFNTASTTAFKTAALQDGFTFWIYSTVGLNGTTANNFVNGYGAKLNGGTGMNVSANTWTKITITTDDINNGCFLQLAGSTAGTIYIDDICPLSQQQSPDDHGSDPDPVEPYLTYKADFDETSGALTLNASSHSGSASSIPQTTTEEDMSYFAFNRKFGLNDYLVFDFTGDNMPYVSFFNSEVSDTIYNHEQDPAVKGFIIANGTTMNNGVLYGGPSGAHANRLTVIGANKIAYKFDADGPDNNTKVQYRYSVGSAGEPWALGMASLQATQNEQYRVIIGFVAQDSSYITLRIYGIQLSTGQAVVNTSLSVVNIFEEGYIALHGHFGRTTTVDKVYDIEEDTTLNALISIYTPPTLVYKGAWDSNGGLVLEQGTHSGNSVNAPTNSDMSYIAFKGEYGLGSYVAFDFTGDNMPYVSFFNNTITNTVFNSAQDTNIAGWVIANGLRENNGTWAGSETGAAASRITLFAPYKIMNYGNDVDSVPDQKRYAFNGSASDPSVLSMRTLQSATDRYRVIIGVDADGSKVKVRVYVKNLLTGEEPLGTNGTVGSYDRSYAAGSIILYGRFHKDTVIDRVLGVDANTTIGAMKTKYAYDSAQSTDYSAATASFDAYAYSGPNDGQWYKDGNAQVANPTDYRTVAQYTTYKDAGFNILLAQNTITVNSETWETDGKIFMDRAYSAGLKVILTDSAIQSLSTPISITGSGTSGTAWGYGASDRFRNVSELDSYIANRLSLYKDHPAFYGVMLGDEPSYHNAYCYGEVYKSLKRVMPDIYVQYNLLPLNDNFDSIKYRFPGLSGNNSATQSQIETAYREYLTSFIEAMGADYIQYDHYPMRNEAGAFGLSNTRYIPATYLRGLQIVCEIAKERDLTVKVVSQTFAMNTNGSSGLYYRQITNDDLYWINNSLLGFGVKEIDYFTYMTKASNYSDGEFYLDGYSLLNRNGTTTGLYDDIQTVISENQTFAPVIKSFEYQGSRVYSGTNTFTDSDHVAWMDNSYAFKRVSSVITTKEDTLVTELFDTKNYNYMYMFMNTIDPYEKNGKSNDTTQTVTITFDSYCTQADVYVNGVKNTISLNNHTYSVSLTAGQAVYVIPY